MDKLVETAKTVVVSAPANYTGAAATTEWISMKLYGRIKFTIHTGAWAGGTAAVTLDQATDVAGTGSKTLAFTKYWLDGVETAVTSNTFNLSTANKMVEIEIEASELDASNDFDCVSVAVASPGSNNDYYAISATCYSARYAQSGMPSPIVD